MFTREDGVLEQKDSYMRGFLSLSAWSELHLKYTGYCEGCYLEPLNLLCRVPNPKPFTLNPKILNSKPKTLPQNPKP